MPKTKVQKKDDLRLLTDKMKEAKSFFFARYDHLEVKDNEELRKELKKEGGEYLVAKKTLTDIALKENNLTGVEAKKMEGQIALVFGFQDEVSPAKILAKYKKSLDNKVDFIGGFLEGKFISASEAVELSKLPSREELYAKVVGSLNAPVSGFVNALAGNLRNLVYVLKAIEEKKS